MRKELLMKKEAKVKRVIIRSIPICIVLLFLTVSAAMVTVASGTTSVSIGSANTTLDSRVTLPIMITNVSDKGVSAARINLTYNPEVVNVIAVENSSFDLITANIQNSSGYTLIIAIALGVEGLTGDVKLADIEFKAVGEEGDVSPLNLEVIELIDNPGIPIPHAVKNGSFTILDEELNPFDTGSPENPYPSIWGIHNGTIKPNKTISISQLYTYPCSGTGGHTEYVTIWNNSNSSWNVTARWKGYGGDWHNITFEESFTLQAGVEYNYTIETGSYPQIHHNKTLTMPNGEITCTKFIDVNGRVYYDWIPAIRLGV
jgi:hypothetical protein